MSGDEAVALEVVYELTKALAGEMSPKRRVAFLHRVSEAFDRPYPISEAHRTSVREGAASWWRRQLPKMLAP